jgi:hypothetical protein
VLISVVKHALQLMSSYNNFPSATLTLSVSQLASLLLLL